LEPFEVHIEPPAYQNRMILGDFYIGQNELKRLSYCQFSQRSQPCKR
jgi:hypothetical protein